MSIDFKRAYASFACEGEAEAAINETTFEDQGWDSDPEKAIGFVRRLLLR
ncbi:MAG: hypothetical protein WDO14_03495 [Bacteroidota bacterium]